MYIHQIWLQGRDSIPEEYIENIKSIDFFNSGSEYKHIIWSEETFYRDILNNNTYLLSQEKTFVENSKIIFEKLKLIHMKVDYMRYIILYLMGGLYIDIDTVAVKSFDVLRDLIEKYECILDKLTIWSNIESLMFCGHTEVINNGIIVARPKTIFLEKLISSINKKILENVNVLKDSQENSNESSILINEITGPKMFTDVFYNLTNDEKNKIYVSRGEYFCTGECNKINDDVVIIHHSDLTWFNKNYYHIIKFYCSRKKMFVLLSTIAILCLVMIYDLRNRGQDHGRSRNKYFYYFLMASLAICLAIFIIKFF
jgi:mannosyltransferase OCH1-like enzyme